MKQEVLSHFRQHDPVLTKVIGLLEEAGLGSIEVQPKTSDMFFCHLCESIVGQQLSEKAGDTIWRRFIALFPHNTLSPAALQAMPDDKIRAAGTSHAKVRYLKNWAVAVTTGQVQLDQLTSLTETEIITHLTQVKGIGQWTAEMFLMFALGREDVFSHGDLGLKNAIKRWYPELGPDFSKSDIEQLTLRWSPYRTYASKVLWRSLLLPRS